MDNSILDEVKTVLEVVDGPGGSERVGFKLFDVPEEVDFWVKKVR